MTDRSAGKRLLSNSRWNASAFAVALLVNFLTVPLVIAAIGLPAFGSAGLVLAMYAPFSLIGTVLGQAVVRDMAGAAVRGDRAIARRVLWSAAFWAFAGSLAVAALAATAGKTLLTQLSSGDPSGAGDWSLALWVGFVGWFMQQSCLLLQSALAALQSYARLALANAVGAVLTAVGLVTASRLEASDIGFLVGTAIGFVLLFMCLLVAVLIDAPWLLRPSRWQRTEAASMLKFARWQGAAHFTGAAANQADRYVLGMVAPLSVVGQYNVAMRLQEVVHMGLLKLVEVLLPHFSITAAEQPQQRADFYVRTCWLVNVISVAALAPLIPISAPLITLWVDQTAAELGATMLQTLATAGVIGSGVNVFTYFAIATDQAQRLAYLNLAHSLVLIALTVPLIFAFGPIAAGVAYIVGNLMRLVGAGWITLQHFADALQARALMCSTWPPLLGGLLGAWALGQFDWSISSWPTLMLAYVGSAIASMSCAVLVSALFTDGRKFITHYVRN
ncbi:oligosaccharide flippase family protein [uncultured Methylibium sp.]|uniref:lipopolysaccharide biosynthesis protein n=1 Tax=uncultured Methylibium sp. TaxID=381093 RepID=UPI0025E0E6F8|nr:oligosaccharide flippase family protein [uncultured Methylibium sp.]